MPARFIGFGITLALQGYLCSYIAFEMCTNNVQRGIAGVMGACVIAANFTHISPILSGPTLGLLLGAFLYIALKPMASTRKEEVL
jgi:phosphate/sulfate permease